MEQRQKTNSITHLVKIVAEEVFDRMFNEKMSDHLSSITDVRSSLENAGQSWERKEDDILVDEVSTAVAQIAKNHGRSLSAIRSRICQKELI